MTTYQAALNNVYDLSEKQRISAIKGKTFAPIPDLILPSKKISSHQKLIIGVVVKDSGYRDTIYTIAEMADRIGLEPETVRKSLAGLRHKGVVTSDKAKANKGVCINLTNICLATSTAEFDRLINEFENHRKQPQGSGNILPDSPVTGYRTPGVYLYKNNIKKRSSPGEKRKVKPPDKKPPTEQIPQQPSAKLFYNNQTEKMGELVNSIENSCDKINDMAKKYNNKFNAYQFVGFALKSKENYNIRAIAGVLYDIVKYNYDYIFTDGFGTWGYLSKSVKIRSGQCNGYDAESFNDQLKRYEQDFCDKIRREGIEF